jgi:hypothetical protein
LDAFLDASSATEVEHGTVARLLELSTSIVRAWQRRRAPRWHRERQGTIRSRINSESAAARASGVA